MPPKKAAAANAEKGDADGGRFHWSPENDRKLLILTLGRGTLTGADYDQLLTAFPGTNLNGVKIRCSRMRVEQRKLYEELGWTLPNGTSTTTKGDGDVEKKATTPKGRKRKDPNGDSTPAKKVKGDNDETTGVFPSNDLGVKEEDTEI